MKKILLIFLTFTLILSLGGIKEVKASNNNIQEQKMYKAYEEVNDYANSLSIDYEFTFESFKMSYGTFDGNLNDYVLALKEAFDLILLEQSELLTDMEFVSSSSSSSSSGGQKWYYDTGTELPQTADYSSCNVFSRVRVGDLIHEDEGGFAEYVGHIAIVEGVFYSEEYDQMYIRVVEAIYPGGVTRSVLDCERVDDKGSKVLIVSGSTSQERNDVVDYVKDQLGKSYNIDIAYKNCYTWQGDWYCSQLAYCAYKSVGYDIEVRNVGLFGIVTRGDIGVTPNDIKNDDDIYVMSISNC